MSYDNPLVITHVIPSVDFGAGGGNFAIKGPKGYENGRLMDVAVMVTETFTEDTTPGYVRVGTSGDADAYAQLELGTDAIATNYFNTDDDTDAIIEADIPTADTVQLEVACIAPTGGTPAGIGHVHITVGYF